MDSEEDGRQIALIANLYARLAQAADYGTLDEYSRLLAPDVTWQMPEQPEFELPTQLRRGRDDALRGAAERRASGLQGPGSATWHVVTNVAVTIENNSEASGIAYWHFYGGVDGKPDVRATGLYRDRFVLSDEGWLLAERSITRG
jgi:3-phenylpropionate/cinnamic acid dioxygenase small subunit